MVCRVVVALGLLVLFAIVSRAEDARAGDSAAQPVDRSKLDLHAGEKKLFRSEFFGSAELVVLPGVFVPKEAETMVLPFLRENRLLFEGKTVLEIGTGTGIISAYAAKPTRPRTRTD